MRSRSRGRLETRRPRHHHGTQRAHSNPGRLVSSLPVLSQDAVRPWMCVASPNAAVAQGDASQAAFDRKLSPCMQEITDLRNQGIHYRRLFWTAGGGPHRAVTRTLQYAAEIAPSRNGQQMSAKSLQHGWKHEIQIALLSFAGEQP